MPLLEHKVYLGLGSNMGDRQAFLLSTIPLLPGRVERISSLYESKPWGFDHQPLFLNLVLCLKTFLPPPNLLSEVKTIEKRRGRKPGLRNGPRPIDIDILFYDEEVIATE
jgi:2-amino-4-hydroxy-6-hydroxymethyldihydropteridine diphosphokinase